MPVTGKKRSGRKRTHRNKPAPDKSPDKYVLAYKNPRPDPVKPKRKPEKPPKPPKGDPVSFVMEYSHIYDFGVDDTI